MKRRKYAEISYEFLGDIVKIGKHGFRIIEGAPPNTKVVGADIIPEREVIRVFLENDMWEIVPEMGIVPRLDISGIFNKEEEEKQEDFLEV